MADEHLFETQYELETLLARHSRPKQLIATDPVAAEMLDSWLRSSRLSDPYWTAPALWVFLPALDEAALYLLAGAGHEVAARVRGVLRSRADKDRRLVDTPSEEWKAADWEHVGWLRVLEEDWRPIPAFRGHSERYALVHDLLLAVSNSDAEALADAIERINASPGGYPPIFGLTIAELFDSLSKSKPATAASP